jgi:polysaccharide pyruvyl transferase WcaK-like protein
MKSPIAILFANLKGNVGDFAILHAMLLELKERFPGHPLHVFSHGFHDVDEVRMRAFQASAPEFDHVGTSYIQGAKRSLARFVPFFRSSPAVQAREISSLARRSIPRASRFRDYEAIFIAGGTHWSGRKFGTSMFGTLAAVHHHNDRIYTFPFSVKPSMQKYNSREALQRYFAMIRDPLVVRDGITKKVMDDLGIPSVFGADCVFSLQGQANDIQPMEGRNRSRIIFALTGSSEKELEAVLHPLSRTAGEIALVTTCELADRKALEPLARELGASYYAPATWQETVAELKASSLVVTNRLHGSILSSFAKTPLLPVTDRKKVEAFAIDARLPHTAGGVHALTDELLERCLADRDIILDRMAQYQSRTRNEALSPLTERASGTTPAHI